MTEMSHHELTLDRTFDAPRELVWQCYTDPAHLTKWWGPRACTRRWSRSRSSWCPAAPTT